MNDQARQLLLQLIRDYGITLANDHQKLNALFRDYAQGQHKREIFLCVQAAREGMVDDLRKNQHLPLDAVAGRLAKQLHDDCGTDLQAAQWTVESWMLALNLKVKLNPIAPPAPITSNPVSKNGQTLLLPEMLTIPKGEFMMGGVKGRDDVEDGINANELPAHKVYLQAFDLGKYPVTFEQFDVFCEETGFQKPSDQGWGRGKRPVIHVSWDDANRYCAWLSKITGHLWHLPSEAQWEYAARAGGNNAYWWGQKPHPGRANYNGNIGKTTPVDDYPANAFGLHDMLGNVWEWAEDVWHGNYQGAPDKGDAWNDGDKARRVLRGGSWYYEPNWLRAASRYFYTATTRLYYVGFRVVRTH